MPLHDLINTDPFLLFFGTFYTIIGLSMFFASHAWQDFIKLFVEHEAISLIFGIMTLPIALFIVFFYNDWSSLASTVLMIMGYISLVKAGVLLLRPSFLQGFLQKGYLKKYLWVDGMSGVVLGVAMLAL